MTIPMRSLALAALLACSACDQPPIPPTPQQVISCERAGGWYTYHVTSGVPNAGRFRCAQELIPPVTPEANDAKK